MNIVFPITNELESGSAGSSLFSDVVRKIGGLNRSKFGAVVEARIGVPELAMCFDQNIRPMQQKVKDIASKLVLPFVACTDAIKDGRESCFQFIEGLARSPILDLLSGQFPMLLACCFRAKLFAVRLSDLFDGSGRVCLPIHSIGRARFGVAQHFKAAQDFKNNRAGTAVQFADLIRSQMLVTIQPNKFGPIALFDFGHCKVATRLGAKARAARCRISGCSPFNRLAALLAKGLLVLKPSVPVLWTVPVNAFLAELASVSFVLPATIATRCDHGITSFYIKKYSSNPAVNQGISHYNALIIGPLFAGLEPA